MSAAFTDSPSRSTVVRNPAALAARSAGTASATLSPATKRETIGRVNGSRVASRPSQRKCEIVSRNERMTRSTPWHIRARTVTPPRPSSPFADLRRRWLPVGGGDADFELLAQLHGPLVGGP